MADGNVSVYNDIKALDVFEYWGIFDAWSKKKEREAQQIKQQNLKQTKRNGK